MLSIIELTLNSQEKSVTGFIRGLFGSKSKGNAEEVALPKEAFYLPADDAKTFGDIDYMRSSKRTRRTFPKQVVGEDHEHINEVSSLKKATPSEKLPFQDSPFNTAPVRESAQSSEPSPFASPSTPSSASSGSTDRRRTDTSMDMFRNMARDIKKKG
jgi:hypothetical protein